MNMILRFFKQWIRYGKELLGDLLTIIYYSGLVFIIGWTIISLWNASPSPMPVANIPATWWTEYVVKPIVSSESNRILFRGIFYLLFWILVFLFIPSATRQLKRFKLFQMEFEVEDKETAAVAVIELQSAKATILSNMYSDSFTGKLFSFLDEESMQVDYFSALSYFLEDFKISYKQNFAISFECITKDFHTLLGVERDYAELSKETGEPQVLNWERPLEKLKKNKLIFHFPFRDEEKVTILSSHSAQFDIIDKQNILFLHYSLMYQAENIEYAMLVEKEDAFMFSTRN